MPATTFASKPLSDRIPRSQGRTPMTIMRIDFTLIEHLRLIGGALLVATGLLIRPVSMQAQAPIAPVAIDSVYYACYVPTTGTIYRIKAPGLPASCIASHVAFSWTGKIGRAHV